LGQPKQLLSFQQKTLLQHAIDEAHDSLAAKTVVVLGFDAKNIKEQTAVKSVEVVNNPLWQEGMASSIRSGVTAMLQLMPSVEAVICMVCDQPFVNSKLLNDMILKFQVGNHPVIACQYENTIGTPVLFAKSFFHELLQLKGDAGAKKLIQLHTELMDTVIFEKGGVDIDTPEAYRDILKEGPIK
jgi:molybdenum cofactor cytidylyltransferase